MQKFFPQPKQVEFVDLDNYDSEPYYLGGIAFGNEIICGCCGGVIDINEHYENAAELGIPEDKVLFAYDSWIDVSSELMGA